MTFEGTVMGHIREQRGFEQKGAKVAKVRILRLAWVQCWLNTDKCSGLRCEQITQGGIESRRAGD
jgi:hypothetical protein